MEANYFEVTVRVAETSANGRKRKSSRKILVEARNFGQAESVVASTHPDYEIVAIKRTKIHEVLQERPTQEAHPQPKADSGVSFTSRRDNELNPGIKMKQPSLTVPFQPAAARKLPKHLHASRRYPAYDS